MPEPSKEGDTPYAAPVKVMVRAVAHFVAVEALPVSAPVKVPFTVKFPVSVPPVSPSPSSVVGLAAAVTRPFVSTVTKVYYPADTPLAASVDAIDAAAVPSIFVVPVTSPVRVIARAVCHLVALEAFPVKVPVKVPPTVKLPVKLPPVRPNPSKVVGFAAAVTRPFVSTVTRVYWPAETPEAAKVDAIEALAVPSTDVEPVTSPVRETVLAVAHLVAVEAFPANAAVIVPAAKFPLSSRFTIIFAVLRLVASVMFEEI